MKPRSWPEGGTGFTNAGKSVEMKIWNRNSNCWNGKSRKACAAFVENLISDDVTNPTSSKKKFCCFIKARRTEGMGVSPLKILGNSLQTPKNKPSFSITNFVLCSVPEILLLLRSLNYVAPPPPKKKKPDLPDYTDCKNFNITEEGVKKLLLNLDHNKACGPDGISPRLLKIVAEAVTPALTLLFRNSYLTGTLPLDW